MEVYTKISSSLKVLDSIIMFHINGSGKNTLNEIQIFRFFKRMYFCNVYLCLSFICRIGYMFLLIYSFNIIARVRT